LDGLAGMTALAVNSFAPLETPNLLGRPLLALKRADLRQWLRRAGQAWLDDESNQNLDFARIRTRRRVAEMAAQGVKFDTIIRLAAAADALRCAQEQASLALLKRCGLTPIEGGWQLDALSFWQAEPLVAERALGWLIHSLTRAERPPEADKLTRLWASLKAMPQRAKTLGGVWIAQKGETVLIKLAPARRGQTAVPSPTKRSQFARLFAVSRQPHEFVTQ
jgi:tRNA(Ile)-lysidine synthase